MPDAAQDTVDELEGQLKAAMASVGDFRLKYNRDMPMILKAGLSVRSTLG